MLTIAIVVLWIVSLLFANALGRVTGYESGWRRGAFRGAAVMLWRKGKTTVRGRVAKRLRREFRKRYGEDAGRAEWFPQGEGWNVRPSVWRMWKSLWKRGELKGVVE